MSLAIDTDTVTSVLIQAEGWVEIVDGSLELDAYDMVYEGRAVLRSGLVKGVPATGFAVRPRAEPSTVIYGPVTSILAVACEVAS